MSRSLAARSYVASPPSHAATYTSSDLGFQCAVLVYAFGVRYRNSRNVQRHKLRIAAEIAERGEVTQTMRESAEIPFGIRAIEKGCEVEGVWNSKASTPLQTPLGSKAASPIIRPRRLQKRRRSSSLASVSALAMPEPALVTPASRQPESPIHLDNCDDGLETAPMARIMQALGREQETFSPQVPCQNEPLDPDSCPHHISTVVSPAEETERITQGLSMGTITSQAVATYSGNTSTRSTSTDTDMRRARTVKAVHELPKPPPRTTRDHSPTKRYTLRPRSKIVPHASDPATFDLINAHRQSLAAEIGQLPSRKRRNGSISTGSSTSVATSSSAETPTDDRPTRAQSWPTAQIPGASNTDSSSIPTPQAVPFRAFVESHPGASGRRASIPGPVLPQEPKNENNPKNATNLPLPRRQPFNPGTNIRSAPTRRCPPSAWTERVREQMEDIASDTSPLPGTGTGTTSARIASVDITFQKRDQFPSQTATKSQTSPPFLPPPSSTSQKRHISQIPLPSHYKPYFADLTLAERRQAPVSHINTAARRVNSGFELLPAGSLGGREVRSVKVWGGEQPQQLPLGEKVNDVGVSVSRLGRKLRKRSRSRSREGGWKGGRERERLSVEELRGGGGGMMKENWMGL